MFYWLYTSARDSNDDASNDGDIDGCGIFWKKPWMLWSQNIPLALFQLKRLIFLQYSSDLIIPLLKNFQGLSINYKIKPQARGVAFVAAPHQTPYPSSPHSGWALQPPPLLPHSWMLVSSVTFCSLWVSGLSCLSAFVCIMPSTSNALSFFPS